MGWSNYIIIPNWKIIIETNRSVRELENYITEAIDKIIHSDTDIDFETSDLKISDMTVKDLCILTSAYDNTSSLSQLDVDKILLYWLEYRNIEYEVKSEFQVDIKQYEENGYKADRIC